MDIYRLPAFGMTTYNRPDGELICDEFAFVTQLEWLEGGTEPTRLSRKRWLLIADEVGTFYPPGTDTLCEGCDGEGEVDSTDTDVPPTPIACPECNGTGDGLGREGFVFDEEADR